MEFLLQTQLSVILGKSRGLLCLVACFSVSRVYIYRIAQGQHQGHGAYQISMAPRHTLTRVIASVKAKVKFVLLLLCV